MSAADQFLNTLKQPQAAEERDRSSLSQGRGDTVSCPYCGEEVPIDTVKCPFCQMMLDETGEFAPEGNVKAKSARRNHRILIPVLTACFVLLVVGAIFFSPSGSSVENLVRNETVVNQEKPRSSSFFYNNGLEYFKSRNYSEAVRCYMKAAEMGHAGAQCNLGYCYKYGYGVEKNIYTAVVWYRKAAEQGNSVAQYNLGLCYENGQGVRQDRNEAVKWLRRSADKGYAPADKHLPEVELERAGYELWKESSTMFDKMPGRARQSPHVTPIPGSIVRCRLSDVADHTGIYVGGGYIIHRDGDGFLDKVTPGKFLARLEGRNEASIIYVACTSDGRPIGGQEIARRAEMALARPGEFSGYNLLLKNCHVFTQYCAMNQEDISFIGGYPTFTGLESAVKAHWGSCEWRIWKDLPRYKKNGRFVN